MNVSRFWKFQIYITDFEWKHKWRSFEVWHYLLIHQVSFNLLRCDQLHSVYPSNQWVLKENFRDSEISVNGVTKEEFFNRGLVNQKLLEDNYHNLPRIFHLESKKNHVFS